MTRKIQLPGFRIGKDGKLTRDLRRLDVSARLRMRGSSKKLRVMRRGQVR